MSDSWQWKYSDRRQHKRKYEQMSSNDYVIILDYLQICTQMNMKWNKLQDDSNVQSEKIRCQVL